MKLGTETPCEKCGTPWRGTYPSVYDPKERTTIAVKCKQCNAPGQLTCRCGGVVFDIVDRQIEGGSYQLRFVCAACGYAPGYAMPRRRRHAA